ncbi:MAG TPA: hypothetical protein VF182_22380 [Candidatus Binatia bacterium]|jgi:hypothetical protein
MAERYRNHLILVKADFDSYSRFWNVRAHIQFNQHVTFRDVLITGPKETFRSQKRAETHIIQEAKKWVDNRLREIANKAQTADTVET